MRRDRRVVDKIDNYFQLVKAELVSKRVPYAQSNCREQASSSEKESNG
ncbi:MAG TPA: hypothetical protein VEI58_11675 [Chthoniobacterales bacterium]|nr:hypothetical protein [Chthoniobacterales bacterium]